METKKHNADLIGKRFGKLVVISYAGINKRNNPLWTCHCDCGSTKIVLEYSLKSGNTKSCGCLRRDIKDITGNKYGSLSVIGFVKRDTQKRKTLWLCNCDCGKEVIVDGHYLKTGAIKSCGCSRRFAKGEAAFRGVFRRIQNSAKKRGYEFNLTEEEVKRIQSKPCFYCGTSPSSEAKYERCYGTYIYNGIDRVDNSIGYTKANCVPCCENCNIGKRTKTVSEFYEWIDRVYKHNR